jgi:hypothetical protein
MVRYFGFSFPKISLFDDDQILTAFDGVADLDQDGFDLAVLGRWSSFSIFIASTRTTPSPSFTGLADPRP